MDNFVLIGTPMPTLHSQINALADSFASAVLDVIRGAPLEELLGEAGGRSTPRRSAQSNGAAPRAAAAAAPKRAAAAAATAARKTGRLPRRSADDIARALDEVVGLVGRHKEGLRAEQIRSELGMQANEMPRILKEGLASRKLKSKGQKRATTYFVK